MLKRMQRKGNPCTLLMGMEIGTVIMENSMEVPQTKIELLYDAAVPLLGVLPKEMKSGS